MAHEVRRAGGGYSGALRARRRRGIWLPPLLICAVAPPLRGTSLDQEAAAPALPPMAADDEPQPSLESGPHPAAIPGGAPDQQWPRLMRIRTMLARMRALEPPAFLHSELLLSFEKVVGRAVKACYGYRVAVERAAGGGQGEERTRWGMSRSASKGGSDRGGGCDAGSGSAGDSGGASAVTGASGCGAAGKSDGAEDDACSDASAGSLRRLRSILRRRGKELRKLGDLRECTREVTYMYWSWRFVPGTWHEPMAGLFALARNADEAATLVGEVVAAESSGGDGGGAGGGLDAEGCGENRGAGAGGQGRGTSGGGSRRLGRRRLRRCRLWRSRWPLGDLSTWLGILQYACQSLIIAFRRLGCMLAGAPRNSRRWPEPDETRELFALQAALFDRPRLAPRRDFPVVDRFLDFFERESQRGKMLSINKMLQVYARAKAGPAGGGSGAGGTGGGAAARGADSAGARRAGSSAAGVQSSAAADTHTHTPPLPPHPFPRQISPRSHSALPLLPPASPPPLPTSPGPRASLEGPQRALRPQASRIARETRRWLLAHFTYRGTPIPRAAAWIRRLRREAAAAAAAGEKRQKKACAQTAAETSNSDVRIADFSLACGPVREPPSSTLPRAKSVRKKRLSGQAWSRAAGHRARGAQVESAPSLPHIRSRSLEIRATDPDKSQAAPIDRGHNLPCGSLDASPTASHLL